MAEARIRPAVRADLPALVEIYNHYVTTSHVTFDVQPFRVQEREAWFAGFAPRGPHRLLVAQLGEDLVGYASSAPFRPKAAYATSVETTVYVRHGLAGRGLGLALYRELLDALASEPDVHRAYAGIALPNPASVSLHEKLGFSLAGTFRQVGRKFEAFWDVSWYERSVP